MATSSGLFSFPPEGPPPENSPFVSVVVPAYNGREYILATLDSVRRQTYPHWELLVCDNGSTDGMLALVQQELRDRPDARIRVHSDPLLPMADNWNRALGYARGEFLKLLPADDILLPTCLEQQVRLLTENPGAGFVTSGKEIIDAGGRKLFTRQALPAGRYGWKDLGRRSLCAVTNLLGEPGGVLFRREIWERCGGYQTGLSYFVDLEILWRFLRQADAVVGPEPVYQFRIHPGSSSASSRRRAVQEYLLLLQRAETDFPVLRRPWMKLYLRLKAHLVPLARGIVFKFSAR